MIPFHFERNRSVFLIRLKHPHDLVVLSAIPAVFKANASFTPHQLLPEEPYGEHSNEDTFDDETCNGLGGRNPNLRRI